MTEYYLNIYPRYLWLELISEDSIKELNENYKTYDGDPLDESFINNSDACTCLISTKDDKKCGCLILFNSDKLTPDIIAHEVFHVADAIGDEVGLTYVRHTGNEHYAYLISYLMRKVYEFIDENKEKIDELNLKLESKNGN